MGDAKPIPPRVIGVSMMFSAVFCALLQGLLQEGWNWWLFFILLAFGASLSGAAMVLVTFINNTGVNRLGGRHLPLE